MEQLAVGQIQGKTGNVLQAYSKEDLAEDTRGSADSSPFIEDFCYPHFKEVRESEGHGHS